MGFGRRLWLGIALMGLAGSVSASDVSGPPYKVTPGLFDTQKPGDLGLKPAPGTETISIFKPSETDNRFNNGAVLIAFKGRLYAQWQSSRTDEDSPDTWVAFASSGDGRNWSPPKSLFPAGQNGQMHSNGGWWTDGKTLIAFINVWPTGFQTHDGGYAVFITSTDGVNWTAPKRVTGKDSKPIDGIIEQDPHATRTGRVVTAFHTPPGMIVAPFYTDDPLAVSGWVRGHMENLPFEGKMSRELEPSLFERGNCLIMVFRDQAESFRQLASESCDNAQSWTKPALTDMPDSRAKQSAGNLPDGTVYLVNAPNLSRVRIPLAVTLSADGKTFSRSYLLRAQADLQPLRYAGQYKRPGYSYPKSVVWNGHLYAAYATNKEDIELTRVPLSALKP